MGSVNLKNDFITTSIYVIVSINLYVDVKSNKYVILYKFSGLILKGFDVIKWNARGAFALNKPNTCKPCLDRIVSQTRKTHAKIKQNLLTFPMRSGYPSKFNANPRV